MQHYFGSVQNGLVILPEEEVHHLLHVKRAELGEEIEVGDGEDVFRCRVDSLDPLRLSVLGQAVSPRELSLALTPTFGNLKGDHNEFIVQKGTELGVSSFVPFLSARTVVRPKDPEDGKLIRLRRVAQESAKQCRRGKIPSVSPYCSFSNLLVRNEAVKLFAYESEALKGASLWETLKGRDLSSILIVIGPEGGFSDGEAKALKDAGFLPVSLGKRILRAETAALYCASVVSAYVEGKE